MGHLLAAPPPWQSYVLGGIPEAVGAGWGSDSTPQGPGKTPPHRPTHPHRMGPGQCDLLFATGSGGVSCSVMSNSLRPHEPYPPPPHPAALPRLLCPCNFPGKNTGVGGHSLLQGIFPTQGSNLHLLHCRQILYHSEPPGKPDMINGGSEGSEQTHYESQMGPPSEPQRPREQGSTVTCPRSHDGLGTLLFSLFFFLLLSIIFVSLVCVCKTDTERQSPMEMDSPFGEQQSRSWAQKHPRRRREAALASEGLGGVARRRGGTVSAMPLVTRGGA